MTEIPTFKFALREDLVGETQFLPTRAEPKATGWDVRAAFPDRKSIIVKPFQKLAIPLGVRGFCPNGFWYEIKPRSSSYTKKHLNALYGTIDETYSGELIFACQYIPQDISWEVDLVEDKIGPGKVISRLVPNPVACYASELIINFGDAIGQIIPRLRQEMEVEEITNSEYESACDDRNAVRRDGGFGSTDGK